MQHIFGSNFSFKKTGIGTGLRMVYFSVNLGSNSAKLQGLLRMSSCVDKILSQPVRQAPEDPGRQKI